MLSVARDPFFKFANVRIKREKRRRRRRRRRREKKRERTQRGEISIDLRANPLPAPQKSEREKGDEKEEQESEARPNPMKMFRVIANSSTRQSTPWSADDGGGAEGAPRKWPRVFGMGWKGRIDGIARESFITIPSILRFAASRLRQGAVVNRFERFARLQIVILPRGKARWSRLTAREKGGKAWCGVGCKRIRHLCDSYRDKSASWTGCKSAWIYSISRNKEILIESIALKRGFYDRQWLLNWKCMLLCKPFFLYTYSSSQKYCIWFLKLVVIIILILILFKMRYINDAF